MAHLTDLVNYFRYLCTQHPLLLHTDAAGHRVFEVRDLEAAFSAIRTGIKEKDFAVRLLLPTVEYRSEANNMRKQYQLGLLVAKYHGRRETTDADVIEAITDAERVAEDFLERIVSDSRNGYWLFAYSVDQVDNMKPTLEVLPALFDGSYSGVLLLFEMAPWRKIISTACDPVAWVDGGLTPPPSPPDDDDD
jgi:hypothetical protein